MISILFFLLCLNSRVFTWRVTVCSDAEFKGACGTLQANGCMNTGLHDDDTFMDNRITSINTYGGCVRVYADRDCYGKSRAYYVGSPTWVDHRNLMETQFGNTISSFGDCLPNECAKYGGKFVENCAFHDEIYVGQLRNIPEVEIRNQNNPISKFQRGYRERVEFMHAYITEADHLDKGTDPNDDVKNYVKSLGQPNDQVGYIVPKILGGLGNFTFNFFPINEKVKVGKIYQQMERMIYDAVKQQGRMEIDVNLLYESSQSTRPSVIIYRIYGHQYYRMRDLNNPE